MLDYIYQTLKVRKTANIRARNYICLLKIKEDLN